MSATAETLDLVWGAAAIAKVIGRSRRQTFHMLENGQIPARKVGSQWVASRRLLQEHFEGDYATAVGE